MKKGLAVLLVGLFVFSFILSMGVVSAGFFTDTVSDPIKKVFTGSEPGFQVGDTTLRLFFFSLLVLLLYSILTTAKFPENAALRGILSAVVGFLAIAYITPAEFFVLVQSYTALGIAVSFFLPIMILIFFTLVIGEKAAFALVFTRVLWFVYSVYIFWKGFVIYVVVDNGGSAPDWLKGLYQNSANVASEGMTKFVEQAAQQNIIMGIILMGAGLIVFYFGVINHSWMALFKEEMGKAQIESYKDKVKKSAGFVKANADAVESS